MSDNIEVIHDKGEVIILKNGKILYEGKDRRDMAKTDNSWLMKAAMGMIIPILIAASGYGMLKADVLRGDKVNDLQDTRIEKLEEVTTEIKTNQQWMRESLTSQSQNIEKLVEKLLNDR